ncbi:AGAP013193-PA-like protein [Anopheles sinensis]|uniref:AGAP013193-PA-like protein n=1 Tax=Anopheles sinensis TaxID=74873 RepID=A0A084WNM9_ANOSI|nr:AGAP013193-PA-like protein [Anopheles sinensis]
MTSKPEPDKLGRNMKALPSNCQKLADGIQQSWNRAIPENDYIQLGTLRYGVRLSNTGLLEGAKAGHDDPVAEGNVRGSINSYEIANGGSSVHSVGGTSSISSGEQQNCCCIGSGGVEMPWTNTYSRTKLPVPSSLAKNRKSSPTASTPGTPTTPTAAATVGVDRQQHQQQMRYPPLAPGRSSNGNCQLSQSTLTHGHGSDDDRGTVSGLVGLGYSNGSAHKATITSNGSKSNHHNNNNNNSHSYHNSNTSCASANGGRGLVDHQQQRLLLEEQQDQQQEQEHQHETSPRCSTVVCCYSNSFRLASSQKKQPEQSPERTVPQSRNANRYQRQQRRDRTIEFPREPPGGRADGAGRRLEGDLEGAYDADGSTLVIADRANPFGGCESSGVSSGYRNDDGGDDLNLNSRTAPRQPQQLHQAGQQRWIPAQGGKDANINNFEKRKISSDPRAGGGAGNARGGERGVLRQKQPSFIGSDIGADELSSTSSSVSPRSASPSVQQAPAPGWCEPAPASTPQAHPPQVATPFGQRRRVLQPPSSLPVVKSYSFHRVDSVGPPTPRSPGQLFDSPAAVDFAGRNRSFRAANHARRLQYGYVEVDTSGTERQNGQGGGEGHHQPYHHSHVTRKSSLPVLGTSNGVASRYLHHHPLSGGVRSSSTDECYPFDKSTCEPECVLTPRSHRKHPCSDAINEIRLQSLNKYCNQLLSGLTGSQPNVRPIDELEDLCFIDSSDLSSTGDDTVRDDQATLVLSVGRGGRECRTQPSIITTTRSTVGEGGSLPATVVDNSGQTLVVASAGVGVGVDGTTNRNNYIDLSSDELGSVREATDSRQHNGHRPAVAASDRVQYDHNDSNASGDYQAVRYGEPRRALLGVLAIDAVDIDIDQRAASSVPSVGDRSHGNLPERLSDTNNNNRRNPSEGGAVERLQQQHQHHQQLQQQQKYTTRSSNNSAVKSVSVGGVGGGPGRPGGVGEQTLPGCASAADESCTSPYAAGKPLVVGYAATAASSDSSPVQHAGLNCFGRSNTLLHAAGGSTTADKSIMEKRNNTLDRLQRLVKKTTSGSAEKQNSSGPSGGGNAGAGGSKTERLRELTELLKGNRAPPVPPPRRPNMPTVLIEVLSDRTRPSPRPA